MKQNLKELSFRFLSILNLTLNMYNGTPGPFIKSKMLNIKSFFFVSKRFFFALLLMYKSERH